MEYTARYYLDAIREDLPPEVFRRAPSRLLWLPVFLGVIALGWWAVLGLDLHWGWKLAAALVIGNTYGCMSFLGHELLHNAVIRRGPLQTFLGWLCFLHYCITPDQWRVWHNREHHHKTGHPTRDPDGFGNVMAHQRSKALRAIEPLGPGSGCLRSIPYFFYFFSFQSLTVLLYHSRRLNFWTPRQRIKVWAQWWAAVLFWVAVGYAVGLEAMLYIYLIPLGIANAIQMSYIATNHFLNPGTHKTNDPLVNSLTVGVSRLRRFLHLGFNYHVEHHVMPAMNPRYAPLVHDLLVSKFPDRYCEMPHWKALYWLYRTPRMHWDSTHLVNPRTGSLYHTIDANHEPQFVGKIPIPVARPKTWAGAPLPGQDEA